LQDMFAQEMISRQGQLFFLFIESSGAIYSRIAPFFALNRIFFSANENGTVNQNDQSESKVRLK